MEKVKVGLLLCSPIIVGILLGFYVIWIDKGF